MDELIAQLEKCIEHGKINKASPYPPDMKGQEGADELSALALDQGIEPGVILAACSKGMKQIGDRFGRCEVFIPELLMSAKAMNAVMEHLKPFFQRGNVKSKGKFVIGTVAGDLHEIGKNLVSMVVSGNGWDVIDLGVDVKTAQFLNAVKDNPGCILGLSALLTTTMINMEKTIGEIKSNFPGTKIIVGGAPLTLDKAEKMGADGYSPNPQGAVEFLNNNIQG